MHRSSRDLAFLLSLGSLPIGCFKDGGGAASAGGTGSTGSGTSGTSGAEGTSTGDETGGSPTTLPGSDATGASDGTTGGATDGATGGDTGVETGGPVSDPQCLGYASRIVECFPRYADAQAYYASACVLNKQKGLLVDGRVCLAALEAAYVCMGQADCADFDAPEGVCTDAWVAADTACPNLFGEDEGTGGPGTSTGMP